MGDTQAPVNGVLLIDKPVGPSSNAVLQTAKRLLGAKRAGHTGTLDPLASGLLVIGLGEATKFAGALLGADKAYRARVKLGERTETPRARICSQRWIVFAVRSSNFHPGMRRSNIRAALCTPTPDAASKFPARRGRS